MGRDKGRGKRGGGRGGGRRFAAQSAEEIEQRNARLAVFDEKRAKRRAEADGDDNNNDNDDDDDDAANAEREAMLVGMRVARMNVADGGGDDDAPKRERKNKGTEGIIEFDNPNRAKGSGMMKIGDLGEAAAPMTRKQREEAEKAAKAAAYRKRHEMGLTEEYKTDMAKLNEVKKRREATQAKAEAEKELAASQEEERKKKAMKAAGVEEELSSKKKKSSKSGSSKKSSKSGADDIPKLDKIAIKKMKPAKLKEELKTRGLDIQGNAKALTERLVQYEADR